MSGPDQESKLADSELSPYSQVPSGSVMAQAARLLQRTQPWVRFLSILGFVSIALMFLVGVSAGAVGLITQKPEMAVLMVIYPLLGVLYAFPSLFLLRYANRIREFVAGGKQAKLEAALDAQRKFWKFVGILTMVSLCLTAFVLFVAFVAALMTRT